MNELNEEQKKDIQDRINSFNEEIKKLLAKFEVRLQPFPEYVPMDNGVFTTIVGVSVIDEKYVQKQTPAEPVQESVIKEG